jgi:hypothetical protein
LVLQSFFHARTVARARARISKDGIRRWPCSLFAVSTRLIAEYVAIMPTRVVQRDAAVERLAEIVTMRRQLCDEHVAAENQAAHLEDAMLRRLSKRRQMRYRGVHIDVRRQDKIRLALAAAATSCRAPAPAPPSCIAITPPSPKMML